MIRRPPRSTLSSSSAASDVYKRDRLLLRVGRRSERESAAVTEPGPRAAGRLQHRDSADAGRHSRALAAAVGLSLRVWPQLAELGEGAGLESAVAGHGASACLLYTS